MRLVRWTVVMETRQPTEHRRKKEEKSCEILEWVGLSWKAQFGTDWNGLDFHQITHVVREIIFLFEVQNSCMRFGLVNNREKCRLWILAVFYLKYRLVWGGNKCTQIFLISSNWVVEQKGLQKVIFLGGKALVVYLWDKKLFERHRANTRKQDLHHEEV